MAGKKNGFSGFLDGIERVGNALPHPVTIFVILTVFLAVLEHLVSLVAQFAVRAKLLA